MEFIDSHAHLFLDDFDEDIKEVLNRARNENVNQILLPNIDSKSIERVMAMYKNYPLLCKPMVGLHPTSVKENFQEELAILKPYFEKQGVIAVGEIGMDTYWDKTYLKQQVIAFNEQVNWALEYDLPVVVHCRDAFDEIFEELEKYRGKGLRGVLHSFTGNHRQANWVAEYGFYIGINGIVTFKNAGLDKVVEKIDLKHLLIETDAPFLSPTPKRGKRNESSYVVHIAKKIADIKETSIEEIADITTKNTKELFKLG